MNGRPLVSVCITTYNQKDYIERCITSAVSQLPPGQLQILVADDGSTDGTREIISRLAQAYVGTVEAVFNEVNLGPSGNLKHLVERAVGEFIAHLDGDDFWLPGKLRRQLAELDEHPEASAVVSNAWVIDPQGRPLGLFTSAKVEDIDLEFLVDSGNFICHASLLYPRRNVSAVLELPVPFIDYRLMVKLAALSPLRYVDAPLVGYSWSMPTSMRAKLDSLVGINYWQALVEASRLGCSDTAFRHGVSIFFERILVKSIVQRQPAVAIAWIARLRAESPVGIDTAILTGFFRVPLAIGRFFRRRGAARFMKRVVLYPR